MARLIYWYGTSNPKSNVNTTNFQQNDSHDFPEATTDTHVLIPANQIISYEYALSQGYDKVPDRIKAKLDQGQRLKGTESQLVEGLRCIRKDARLAPEERRHHWFFNFEEPKLSQVSDEKEKIQEKDDDSATQVSFQSAPVVLLSRGKEESSISMAKRARNVRYSSQGELLTHNRVQSRPSTSPMVPKKAVNGSRNIYHNAQTRQPTVHSRSLTPGGNHNHTKNNTESPIFTEFCCVMASPSDLSSVNNGYITDVLKPRNNHAEKPPSLLEDANFIPQVIKLPTEGTIIGLVIWDDNDWNRPFLKSCVENSAAEKQIPSAYQSNMWILDIQAGTKSNSRRMGGDPSVSEIRTNSQARSLLKDLQHKGHNCVTLTLTPRIQHTNYEIMGKSLVLNSGKVQVGSKTSSTSRSLLLESAPFKNSSVPKSQHVATKTDNNIHSSNVETNERGGGSIQSSRRDIRFMKSSNIHSSNVEKNEREGGSIQSSRREICSIKSSRRGKDIDEERSGTNAVVKSERLSLKGSEQKDEAKRKMEDNEMKKDEKPHPVTPLHQGGYGEPNKVKTRSKLRLKTSEYLANFNTDKYLPYDVGESKDVEEESILTFNARTVESSAPTFGKDKLVAKKYPEIHEDEKEKSQRNNVKRDTNIFSIQDVPKRELTREGKIISRKNDKNLDPVVEESAKKDSLDKNLIMTRGAFKSSMEKTLRSDNTSPFSSHDAPKSLSTKDLSSFSENKASGVKKDISLEIPDYKKIKDDNDLESDEERNRKEVVPSPTASMSTKKQTNVRPQKSTSETNLEPSKDTELAYNSVKVGQLIVLEKAPMETTTTESSVLTAQKSSTSEKVRSSEPTVVPVNKSNLELNEEISSLEKLMKNEASFPSHYSGSQSSTSCTDDVTSAFTSLTQKNRDRMNKLGALSMPSKQNLSKDTSNVMNSISSKISELSYPPTPTKTRQTLANRIQELAFQQQVVLDPNIPKCDQVARLECDLNGSRIYGKLIDRVTSLEDDIGLR